MTSLLLINGITGRFKPLLRMTAGHHRRLGEVWHCCLKNYGTGFVIKGVFLDARKGAKRGVRKDLPRDWRERPPDGGTGSNAMRRHAERVILSTSLLLIGDR